MIVIDKIKYYNLYKLFLTVKSRKLFELQWLMLRQGYRSMFKSLDVSIPDVSRIAIILCRRSHSVCVWWVPSTSRLTWFLYRKSDSPLSHLYESDDVIPYSFSIEMGTPIYTPIYSTLCGDDAGGWGVSRVEIRCVLVKTWNRRTVHQFFVWILLLYSVRPFGERVFL